MNEAVLTDIIPDDMPDALGLHERLQADLRSDHAGETGAVYIYRGILALSLDPEIRAFAREHLATEQRHLAFFEDWLPPAVRSRLLPLWRLAGWLLGAVSTLGGRRGVYLTIEAVESFVVQHYQEQIDYLIERREHREVRAALRRFQRDEDDHREDARLRGQQPGPIGRAWRAVVGEGSRLAVVAARKI
jgi:ubiquinone biosynthesis monooxygenase Coq7